MPLDQEVDEELALHIEMRTRELVERGLDPKTARDIVLSRIGDLGRLKRTCVDLGRKREREMRLTRFIEEFRDDVRLAVRQLMKAPGFTIVATITLALGIGVNSAIFALVDATLLRPLPFHEPERLVAVWERTDRVAHGFASPLNMQDWNERTRSFELISGFVPGMGAMVMSGSDGTAETVSRQWVHGRDLRRPRREAGRRPDVPPGRQRPAQEHGRPQRGLLAHAVWRRRVDRRPRCPLRWGALYRRRRGSEGVHASRRHRDVGAALDSACGRSFEPRTASRASGD